MLHRDELRAESSARHRLSLIPTAVEKAFDMLDQCLASRDGLDVAMLKRTRVAVVDDHRMVADGLARIVSQESDFELVGVAASVAETMVLMKRELPDVVLLDYHLPDGEGDEVTKEILLRWPEIKILMLSGSGGSDLLARAIEAGCSGFLMKTRPAIDVVDAIRSSARGELVVRSDELAGLLGKIRGHASGDDLTVRELEVLRLLARGRATDDIATMLYLSVHTVRNHIRNILTKLDVHSKLAAVAVATHSGILAIDEIG